MQLAVSMFTDLNSSNTKEASATTKMLFLKYISAPFAISISTRRLVSRCTVKVCDLLCIVFTEHVLAGKEHLKELLVCALCQVQFSSKIDLDNHVKGLCFVCFIQAQFQLSSLA